MTMTASASRRGRCWRRRVSPWSGTPRTGPRRWGRWVARLRPDVVLLDVQLPGIDGFVVAEQLAAVPDPPRVVLISSRDAASYGPRLDGAPVCGFLAKRALSGASLAALVG